MILDKIVEMKWNSNNKKRYMVLGYKFTKMGNGFKVKIKHLPNSSHVKIRAKCDSCEKIRISRFRDYRDLCLKCSRTGEKYRKKQSEIRKDPNITDEERASRKEKRYMSSSEGRWWSKQVKIRDSFTCQCCGQVGGVLRSHHIYAYKKYPELRYILANGICLCEKCHKLFHKLYGIKGDNTLEQFEEFMSVYKTIGLPKQQNIIVYKDTKI